MPHRSVVIIAIFALAAVPLLGRQTGNVAVRDSKPRDLADAMINIGTRRLHISCSGGGSPTVVIERGFGTGTGPTGPNYAAWQGIQQRVAAMTRVCLCDRTGRGRSDPPTTTRTASDIVADLHQLPTRGSECLGSRICCRQSIGANGF